jgi:hypothetical protein
LYTELTPPLAQHVQNAVRAEHQFLRVALEELIDLVDRQPAAGRQVLGQRADVGEAEQELGIQFGELILRQQRMDAQHVHQRVDRGNVHV